MSSLQARSAGFDRVIASLLLFAGVMVVEREVVCPCLGASMLVYSSPVVIAAVIWARLKGKLSEFAFCVFWTSLLGGLAVELGLDHVGSDAIVELTGAYQGYRAAAHATWNAALMLHVVWCCLQLLEAPVFAEFGSRELSVMLFVSAFQSVFTDYYGQGRLWSYPPSEHNPVLATSPDGSISYTALPHALWLGGTVAAWYMAVLLAHHTGYESEKVACLPQAADSDSDSESED